MIILIEYCTIFLQAIFLCLFLSLSGFLFKKCILNYSDTKNFEENSLFGFILIGFISLLINFFYPLNLTVNNILFLFITYAGYKFGFFKQNKKELIKKLILITCLSFILIIHSNVNTPDALLYHLPYSKIITEHKIIIGLSNLHSRFGFISIFQYISSFFNNSLFQTNGLLLPAALLVSNFLFYLLNKFRNDFKNNLSRQKSFFVYLIIVFSLYSFNRYSGYGNDAQAHIYYFVIVIYFLEFLINKKKILNFQKILIFSLFTFLLKPFYIISFLIPFLLFFIIRDKYKILNSKSFIFIFSFFTLWILKTFLTTGCFIYPLKFTCNTSVIWFDSNIDEISITGESWAKAWPQNTNKKLNQVNYIKHFNWVESWIKIHFKVILEKITPIIIFIIFNFLFFYFTKCLKKNYQNNNQFFYISFFIINLLFVIIWFVKIPIYRQGLSFIYTFLLFLFYFIFTKHINLKKIKKFYNFFIIFIIVIFSAIIIKNTLRVFQDFDNPISPALYDNLNSNNLLEVFNENNLFTHYEMINNRVCGFSKSPCTSFNVNINKKYFFNYLIYYEFK